MSTHSAATLGLLVAILVIAGCSEDADRTAGRSAPTATAAADGRGSAASRWYDEQHVARGAEVYAQHCASCHGENAQGAFAWRNPGADGKLPPPPLNGTGHAWHHPVAVLGSQIKFGAPGGVGTMPGFDGVLEDEQIVDVIAWFQSLWPEEIYASWLERERRSRQP